jgi:hypothetical protein
MQKFTSHWKYNKFTFTKIAGGVIQFSKYMHHILYTLYLYGAVNTFLTCYTYTAHNKYITVYTPVHVKLILKIDKVTKFNICCFF